MRTVPAPTVQQQPPSLSGNGSQSDPSAALGEPPAGSAGTGRAYFSVTFDKEREPTKLVILPCEGLDHPVPEELLRLRAAVESVGRDLSCIFNRKGREKGTETLANFLADLKEVAHIGLAKPYPQVELAYSMLDGLKLDALAREAGPRRIDMVHKLARWSAALAAAGLVLYSAHAIPAPRWNPVRTASLLLVSDSAIRCLGLLLTGCASGFWLSSILRPPPLAYAELTSLEREIWGPRTRLAFATVLTLILAMMFHLKVIVVDLGSVDTTQMFKSPFMAFLVGALCGIGENALSERVAPFAARVVGKK